MHRNSFQNAFFFHFSDPADVLVRNESRSHVLRKIDGVGPGESFIAVSMLVSGNAVIKKVTDAVDRGN